MATSGALVVRYAVTVQVTDQKHNGIRGSLWITDAGAKTTHGNGFYDFTFDVPVGGKTLVVRLIGTHASDDSGCSGPNRPGQS